MVKRDRRGAAAAAAARYGGAPETELRKRMQLLLAGFLLIFAIVAGRLCQLHLNPRLELTAEEQFHIGQVELREPRGEIFDRNGLLLATDRLVPSLWADPRKVSDPRRLAALIRERLGNAPEDLEERLSKRDASGNPRKFVWIKRWLSDVPEAVLTALVDDSHGALAIQHEPVRYYPHRDTAAHLLGFVNRSGEASEGLELLFDNHLRSVPGWHTARKDVNRRLLDSLTLEYTPPKGGDAVQLTLDTEIQHALERALDSRIEETKASRGMGLIINPYSGAILALATRPAFDPNQYDEFPAELRKNSALIDVFEPGSAFKIITAAAALEHRLITTDTLIDCENGSFNPYGHRIRDVKKMGIVPFSRCFEQSSNIALIKVGAMLGPERMEEWILRFGFGVRTCPDFQVESAGIFRPRGQWSRLTMGSLPMGQELAVTMPQLARAFAVIANGGYLVEPYFVERAISRMGEVTYQRRPPERQRILSPETVETMRELCYQVVAHGTGRHAAIPDYRVGGKTGTAQMARKDGRGYDPDRVTAIFAGFAPATNPQVVAVFVIQEPMVRPHYGGVICGPLFKTVVRDALIRLHVPEDPMEDAPVRKNDKTPGLIAASGASQSGPHDAGAHPADLPWDDADTVAERAELEAFAQSLDAMMQPLDTLRLVAAPADATNFSSAVLPDFTGMTKRQALDALRRLGVAWDQQGSGWVVAQDPPPGTPVREVAYCALEFSNVRTETPEKDDQKRTS